MSRVAPGDGERIFTEHWGICPQCDGMGTKIQKLAKKTHIWYQKQLKKYETSGRIGPPPVEPKRCLEKCRDCGGSGLVPASCKTLINESYPHIAIIGGGISGVALAVACRHRGIPYTLYERDSSFDARSQGYGLTLQQANKAMEAFGIFGLRDAIWTSRHLVYNPQGKLIGEWGKKKHDTPETDTSRKQKNVHIARQSLRMQLLSQLGEPSSVQWGHKLIDFLHDDTDGIDMTFDVNGVIKEAHADMIVGADGIRSIVRASLMRGQDTPLHYTGFMVILGICGLDEVRGTQSDLLDGETVFQTVSGHERIYMMPYSGDAIMWQMSFPLSEGEARALSSRGPEALKQEALIRTPWHDPIPQILSATHTTRITGYPVYDRESLSENIFTDAGNVTLIGDAVHPMSPFKGQGANRALLDALALARSIYSGCTPGSQWRNIGLRHCALEAFERDMIAHSAPKVRDSAEAGQLLHSLAVLHDGDTPRGRGIKKHS